MCGGPPLPRPQLPAPRPSASCLSGWEPGAFQEHCPREEGPGSPLGPGWPQMASGPSSPRKNGSRAQDGLSWARSILRTGLANRTSFPKLRKGLEINAGEGCRLPRVDRERPAHCPVARSASPALSQPFPRCGWGLGGLLSRQILLQRVGWVEGQQEEPGGGRPEPSPREAPLPPSDPTPSVQLLFIRKGAHLKPQVSLPQPGDLTRADPHLVSAGFETPMSRLRRLPR